MTLTAIGEAPDANSVRKESAQHSLYFLGFRSDAAHDQRSGGVHLHEKPSDVPRFETTPGLGHGS